MLSHEGTKAERILSLCALVANNFLRLPKLLANLFHPIFTFEACGRKSRF